MQPLHIDARTSIDPKDLSWTAVRASGPGGQNVNKVSSKVELRFDLEASTALPPWAKARMRTLCRNRLDAEGRVRIVSQATRDQAQNLERAREKLVELITEALHPPAPRHATKPTRASKRRRLSDKRRVGEKKSLRKRVADD
jgi:ribosome-associated protein